MKRSTANISLLMIGIIIGMAIGPLNLTSFAQPTCRSFPETGKQVCGRFLEYWTGNGGLAQQGLPLSGEFVEVSDLNNQPYTVQYFERSVFEKHPENAAPYDVLLSQLGTFQWKRKYPNGEPSGGPTPIPPIGEQPVSFNGTTRVNTTAFNLQGGTYELAWSVDFGEESQTAFSCWLKGTNGGYSDLLVNLIVKQADPHSGTNLVYNVPAGQYYFEVGSTRGSWQIMLTRK